MAVRLRGRPWPAVLADMIEGVIAVNDLAPPLATRVRTDLWERGRRHRRTGEVRVA